MIAIFAVGFLCGVCFAALLEEVYQFRKRRHRSDK